MSKVDGVRYNAFTKHGNPYKKTNACRKIGFWTPVAGIGASSIVLGGVLSKTVGAKGFKNVLKTFFDLSAVALLKNSIKMLKYGAIGFVIGCVGDKIINHNRRKNADKTVYLK